MSGKCKDKYTRERKNELNSFSVKIFQERLDMDKEESLDIERVMGVAHFLSCLNDGVCVQHPHGGFNVYVDKLSCPLKVYQVVTGGYRKDMLDSLNEYIKLGAKVMVVGTRLGVSTVATALVSGEQVLIVEADKECLDSTLKTCALNKVKVKALEKAFVAGHREGKVSISLPEGKWSKSAFVGQYEDGEKSFLVKALDIQKEIKEHDIDTLVINISEVGLDLFQDIPLRNLHTLVVDFSGEEGMVIADIISHCIEHGLILKDIKGGVSVFKRGE